MVSKLKVSPFTSDFRANECLGTGSFFGKICRCAISLNQAEILVKRCAPYAGFHMQVMLERHRSFFVSADDQCLRWPQRFEMGLQPRHARVALNPVRFRVLNFGMQESGVT